MNANGDATRKSITDSPLFWLPVFLVGAMVALALTVPKYSWRQPQLERTYQARELSGYAVAPTGESVELSHSGEAKLTLRPLFLFFGTALFLSTFGFWWWRISGRHHFGTQSDGLPAADDAHSSDSKGAAT